MDCRHNNGSVKAVSTRHCAATSALHSCCFNCRAGQSQGQCPLHCCWGTTRSERSPTFAAQLHLPALDLFWANVRVQLHLPPLDLAWNPVMRRCSVDSNHLTHLSNAALNWTGLTVIIPATRFTLAVGRFVTAQDATYKCPYFFSFLFLSYFSLTHGFDSWRPAGVFLSLKWLVILTLYCSSSNSGSLVKWRSQLQDNEDPLLCGQLSSPRSERLSGYRSMQTPSYILILCSVPHWMTGKRRATELPAGSCSLPDDI